MAEKVARVETVARPVREVLVVAARMAEPPAMTWRAGQFISLRCNGDERRSYSIASAPGSGDRFELLVKLVPGGVGSGFFERLRPGDELRFTGPMGFFVCELAHPGDIVFAVTGAGIAAALPMIEETLARPAERERGRVLLYWGLRHEDDVYRGDRLDALAAVSPRFAAHVCLSQPGPTWTGANGRITRHVIDAVPHLEQPIFYLVGNGDMIRELRGELQRLGIDRRRQIKTEAFYATSEP